MTARSIYERTLAILQEQDSEEGAYDTERFERAAPSLIALLCVLLDELDFHIKGQSVSQDALCLPKVVSLEDEVHLHPILCATLVPLGLAFLLLSEENASRASLYYNLYQNEKQALFRRYKRAKRHHITQLY